MSNKELNEQIAESLGFEKYQIKNGPMAWKYPEAWRDEATMSPMTSIPDFMKMIQQTREISNTFKYGIPLQRL